MSDPMLTTNQVRDGYAMNEFGEVNGHWAADFDRWFFAHDAAIRADQIEKDAALAEKVADESPYGFQDHSNEIVAAIRAQLTEGDER